MVLAAPGDAVAAGDPVLELHYRDACAARRRALAAGAARAITIGDDGARRRGRSIRRRGALMHLALTVPAAARRGRDPRRSRTPARPTAARSTGGRSPGGSGLQIVFALIVLKTSVGQRVFTTLGADITRLLAFAGVGSAFVFGPLGDNAVWGRRS